MSVPNRCKCRCSAELVKSVDLVGQNLYWVICHHIIEPHTSKMKYSEAAAIQDWNANHAE